MLRFSGFALALLANCCILAQTGNGAPMVAPDSVEAKGAKVTDERAPGWDLERCLNYALEHNLNVELGEIGIEQAAVDLQRSRLAQYPNVSANSSYGIGFGRATNQNNQIISASRTQSTNFSVNAGMTIYNGGSIRNGIRLSESAAELAKLDRDAAKNAVMLDVAQAYMAVLLAQENVAQFEAQIKVSRDNLANSQKLADAGVIPEGNLRDLEAQIASDEFNLINAENGVATAYLNLRLVMQAEDGLLFRVAEPESELLAELLVQEDYDVDAIYRYAAKNLPAYAGNAVAERMAELGITIARAGFFPTLGLGGGANTQWFTINGPAGDILPDFGTQLDNNFGQNVGVNLSIPIFSNGINKAAVRTAELDVKRTQVANAQELNSLRQLVQQAVVDAQNNAATYRSALKLLEARQLAADFAQKRFEAGQSPSLDLNNARNLVIQAQAALLQAKYNYLLAVKVLDFYQGRPLYF